MKLNKSQSLIIKTTLSSVLGFPNIDKIFTEEIIKLLMQAPNTTIILIVSILKILLAIASVVWLIQLINNMRFVHRTKHDAVFQDYILKLVVTGIFSFIGALLLKSFLRI